MGPNEVRGSGDVLPVQVLMLLADAGVTVGRRALTGGASWHVELQTRAVWIEERCSPDEAVRALSDALRAAVDGVGAAAELGAWVSPPRLVHSAKRPERRSRRRPAELSVVRDQ